MDAPPFPPCWSNRLTERLLHRSREHRSHGLVFYATLSSEGSRAVTGSGGCCGRSEPAAACQRANGEGGVGTLPPPPQVLDFKGTCDASIGPACQPATGSQAP